MKRLLSCIMIFILMAALSGGAWADIANAHVDDFYWRNSSKFDYSVGGIYIVNSPDGYVTAWTSPSATKKVQNIPNGTRIRVTAAYKGWATSVYLADAGYGVDGNQWLPMELLTPEYGGQDFFREYEAEILPNTDYTDVFDGYRVKDKLCFYSFPGSGRCSDIISSDEYEEAPQLQWIFIDAQGRHWGYCEGYIYREIAAWICLEAPENDALPVTLDKGVVLKAEPADTQQELPALRYEPVISGLMYAAFAALGLALIGAGVLIYSVRRRGKNSAAATEPETNEI